jgi:hypothetical protein
MTRLHLHFIVALLASNHRDAGLKESKSIRSERSKRAAWIGAGGDC